MVLWKTVSLPKEMLNEIKKFIEENPEYGYASVSDFVTTAIRAYDDYRRILEGSKGQTSESSQEKTGSP